MPTVKINSKLPEAAAEGVATYARQMFEQFGHGEWVAVVRLRTGKRSEEIKTTDEEEFIESEVRLNAVDMEIVTGPHKEAAERALEQARWQRKTAGTLLGSVSQEES